jgi:hypothetical protein
VFRVSGSVDSRGGGAMYENKFVFYKVTTGESCTRPHRNEIPEEVAGGLPRLGRKDDGHATAFSETPMTQTHTTLKDRIPWWR